MGKVPSFLPLQMHRYPSPQSLPTRGRSLKFPPLKWRLSFPVNPSPHGEGVKLSLHLEMHTCTCSYPSPQILPHPGKDLNFLSHKYMAILDHMGKESSILPAEMQSYPSPRGKESCFLPQNASFPSFSPKCNTTLPHKSFPIYMYREGSRGATEV